MTCGDTLRDYRRTGVLPYVYHLCSRVSLLIVIGDSNAVELCLRIVTTEYTRRVFPCYGRACLYLCPRQLRTFTAEVSALRHKVQHTTFAVLVARIPVLYRRVLHLSTVIDYYLHNGGVQLVLVAHRSGTALKVRYVGIVVGNDEGTFKLSCTFGVDTEVRA